MPENPKKKSESVKKTVESSETAEDYSPPAVQPESNYYYDDSHGYEVYKPEDEENDECAASIQNPASK